MQYFALFLCAHLYNNKKHEQNVSINLRTEKIKGVSYIEILEASGS